MADEKFRQLGMFGLIVGEVVITPTLLGGVAYFLLKNSALQLAITSLAALIGLGIAFYRISLLRKQFEADGS
jgi:FtsH-binding integral membrane protein